MDTGVDTVEPVYSGQWSWGPTKWLLQKGGLYTQVQHYAIKLIDPLEHSILAGVKRWPVC